jgi:hypothetical protein
VFVATQLILETKKGEWLGATRPFLSFGVGENSKLILSEHAQSLVPDDSQLPVDRMLPRQKR